MNNTQKKSRYIIGLITMVMAFAMILGCMTVMAKSKATLWSKSCEIGVNETYAISLNNIPKGAKYTYKSDKTSVAKVSKKGVVTGISVGTAKITVSETYKKKTQKVGTFTVKVKKAAISNTLDSSYFSISNQAGYLKYWYEQGKPFSFLTADLVAYMNPKATYKYSSSDSKKLAVTSDGKIKDVNGTGSVIITIKETYNKKTTKVGTFAMNLVAPQYKGDAELNITLGDTFNPTEQIYNLGAYLMHFDSSADYVYDPTKDEDGDGKYAEGDAIEFVNDEVDGKWYGDMKARVEGTVYLYYYPLNYTTNVYDTTPIAKIKVNIKDCPEASDISVSEDSIVITDFSGIDDYYGTDFLYAYAIPKDPNFHYTGKITVTSTNESVMKVEYDEYSGCIECYPQGPGIGEIIIKANGVEKKIPVTVTVD